MERWLIPSDRKEAKFLLESNKKILAQNRRLLRRRKAGKGGFLRDNFFGTTRQLENTIKGLESHNKALKKVL